MVFNKNLNGLLEQLASLGFKDIRLEYYYDDYDPEPGWWLARIWSEEHLDCESEKVRKDHRLCEDCDDSVNAHARTPYEALYNSANIALNSVCSECEKPAACIKPFNRQHPYRTWCDTHCNHAAYCWSLKPKSNNNL